MSSARANPAGAAAHPGWDVPDIASSRLRDLAWRHCGILRDRQGLEYVIDSLSNLPLHTVDRPLLAAIELRNIYQAAGLIARSALWREESRGAHYRTDFPEKNSAFERDSVLKLP
jgi:aspartate oxidase